MSIFDLGLIIIIAGFVINGLFKGIIKMIGAIVSLFLGIFIASRFYLIFYSWIATFISGTENVLKVVSFFIVLLLTSKIIELIFVLIEKLFKLAAFIPGTKLINNILGAIFGLLLGSIFLGILIYIMLHYLDIGGSVSNLIDSSVVAPILLSINRLAVLLLPEPLKIISSFIQ